MRQIYWFQFQSSHVSAINVQFSVTNRKIELLFYSCSSGLEGQVRDMMSSTFTAVTTWSLTAQSTALSQELCLLITVTFNPLSQTREDVETQVAS